ncbi:hypothetical protein M5K25_026030 [Dendrobium thyrsiflorum]|uniref:Uncharacterized protein n=1 Tax=Dendrobium thyrsiflorum TaxID=117978 RepID=A0ABD0TW85_DENTH
MVNRRSSRIVGTSRSNSHQSRNQSMNHRRPISASFYPGGQNAAGEGTSGPSLEERIRKMEESHNEILQLLRETRQPALPQREEVFLPRDPPGLEEVQPKHLQAEIPLPPPRRHSQSHQNNEVADTASSTHPNLLEDLAQAHVAEFPRNALRHELRRLKSINRALISPRRGEKKKKRRRRRGEEEEEEKKKKKRREEGKEGRNSSSTTAGFSSDAGILSEFPITPEFCLISKRGRNSVQFSSIALLHYSVSPFAPTARRRSPYKVFLPPAENRSTLPSPAENHSTLPSPTENRYPFSPLPGEGREPDTMLTYFTRKPPELLGRDLKKKRRSSLWATLRRSPYKVFLPPAENRSTLPSPVENRCLPSPVENRSTLPSPAENRSTLPSPAENRSTLPSPVENQCPFSLLPGEGRELDTMLTYFTRKPPELLGRNLKKKRRSSLWATFNSFLGDCPEMLVYTQTSAIFEPHKSHRAGGQASGKAAIRRVARAGSEAGKRAACWWAARESVVHRTWEAGR